MDRSYLSLEINPELLQKRKLKGIRITPEVLAGFLKADKYRFEVLSPIPSDAQLTGIYITDDYNRGGVILLYFYHDSFEEIPESRLIPDFEESVMFKRIEGE